MTHNRWRKWFFRLQEAVGMTEKECLSCLILSALLIAGAAIRYLPKSPVFFDDGYYAELDAEFARLTARADSFDRVFEQVPPQSAASEEEAVTGSRLDLNLASSEELESLPRIGPAMAARILALRRRMGRFEDVTDLLLVRGIGERTLERLRPEVTVRISEPASVHPPRFEPPSR